MEVRYLEAKDSLTYNGFRALQIVKNGVHINSDYIGGVVTLSSMGTDNNFTSNNGDAINFNILNGKLVINNGSSSYQFNDINITNNNFSLRPIEDTGATNLYLIEFNATRESVLNFSSLTGTDITTFQRLVYTK
jgi:hypothetical protein